MPPPNRIQQPTGIASLKWVVTDDGSRTLVDIALNETYHSGCGAVAETLVVYLGNSGVVQRLRNNTPTVVLEYGLGTATGFLLTAALAEYYHVPLAYHAFEYSLLPQAVFSQLDLHNSVATCVASGFAKSPASDLQFRIEEFACLPELQNAFCNQAPRRPTPGKLPTARLRRVETQLSRFVRLHLILGDARIPSEPTDEALAPASCDAIYFDPFSPETNPGMWSNEVLQRAASYLKPSGTFTSYCVKGTVRKAIAQAGLQVAKVPGPSGGKREVLVATKL